MPKYQQRALIWEDWWIDYLYEFKLRGEFKIAVYSNEADQVDKYLIYQRKEASFTIVEWDY